MKTVEMLMVAAAGIAILSFATGKQQMFGKQGLIQKPFTGGLGWNIGK